MDTEDLNTNNEPIATTDGLDTAVKSVFIPIPSSPTS